MTPEKRSFRVGLLFGLCLGVVLVVALLALHVPV